jgi:hypothetical protein
MTAVENKHSTHTHTHSSFPLSFCLPFIATRPILQNGNITGTLSQKLLKMKKQQELAFSLSAILQVE